MAIIGINVAVFVLQLLAGAGAGPNAGEVYTQGVLFGPLVNDGEWYRIISGGFLHASFFHLGLNMYAIWIFASVLERAIGPVRTLLIYAGGLVGGSAAVLWFNWPIPTLGASGAALGLAGGMLALLRSRGVPLKQTSLSGVLLLNLALPFIIPGISFWGHLGGVAGGLLLGAIIGTVPARFKQSPAITNIAAVAAIVVMAVLAIVGGQAARF